jgi:hypothetical protein
VRLVRSALLISAATAAAITGLPLTATATPVQHPPHGEFPARAAAARDGQEFTARMMARLHPHSVNAAAPGARPLAGTAAAQPLKITNVKSVSEDTLPVNSSEIEPDTQTEPDIAIDPANPRIISEDVQEGRNGPFGGAEDAGYATSHNGGRTWVFGDLPLLTTAVGGPFALTSDSVVAFGPDGSAYASTIPFNETDPRSAVAVQRSTDGGFTFAKPSLVVDDNNINIFNDKDWIVVDTNRHSPHFGRIYAVWSRFITTGSGSAAVTHSPGAVSWSDNHGKTWSPIHFTTGPKANTEGLIPLIHPDGSITVIYDKTVGFNDFEVAQTSHNGGRTWSKPATVGQFLGSGVPDLRTGGLPAAAIDPSTGKMYVVWQDTRFNPSGLNDIVLSTSANGQTWTAPQVVNPRVAGLDRFTPAVAAAGGTVSITYRTRAANGTAPTVTEDFIASTDGGKTFGYEHQVGPPTVLQYAAVSDEEPPPVAFLGDYMGLAATRREVELAWNVATRPNVAELYHQTTWAATVTP